MSQHQHPKTHAAAPPLPSLWCKAVSLQSRTWLTKDGEIMGCHKDSWQKSFLLSRNHWWHSAAQHSQPECCCLVQKWSLPWGGNWRQLLCQYSCSGVAPKTPSQATNPDTPSVVNSFWAPAVRSKMGMFLGLKYPCGKELHASLRKGLGSTEMLNQTKATSDPWCPTEICHRSPGEKTVLK